MDKRRQKILEHIDRVKQQTGQPYQYTSGAKLSDQQLQRMQGQMMMRGMSTMSEDDAGAGGVSGPGGGSSSGGIYTPPLSPDQHLPSYIPKITDQWIYDPVIDGWPIEAESCVANSLAHALEVLEHYERNAGVTDFSISWIYGNRLSSDDQAEGMFVAQALNRVQIEGALKFGSSINPDRPYFDDHQYFMDFYLYPDVRHYNSMVNGRIWSAKNIVINEKPAVASKASLYRIANWWTCPTHQSVKNAIAANGVAIMQMWSGNWLWNVGSDGIANSTDYTTSTLSHVMCLIGWKNINGGGYWIAANGWGEWSGDNGLFYIPHGHPAIIDAWGLGNLTTPAHVPEGTPRRISVSNTISAFTIDFHAYYVTDFDGFHVFANNLEGSGDVYKTSVPKGMYQTSMYQASFTLDQSNHEYLIKIVPYNSTGFGPALETTIVTGNLRPDEFDWQYSTIAQNATAVVDHRDWNNLSERIKQFRDYKGLPLFVFTSVSPGQNFLAARFNDARSAIIAMAPPTGPPGVKVGLSANPTNASNVVAADLNLLVSSLNSIP